MPRPKIAAQPDELTPDEAVQIALDLDCQQRKWLRTLIPFVWDQTAPASSPAVEFGRNLVRLAACQRACRILRADLTDGPKLAETGEAERALAAEGPD